MMDIFRVCCSMPATLSKAVQLLYVSVLCFGIFDAVVVQRETETGVLKKAVH
jgi:uncharacterized membrane protein